MGTRRRAEIVEKVARRTRNYEYDPSSPTAMNVADRKQTVYHLGRCVCGWCRIFVNGPFIERCRFLTRRPGQWQEHGIHHRDSVPGVCRGDVFNSA